MPFPGNTETILSAGSMATSLTSSVVDVGKLKNFCVQFVWTSTPTGTVQIEASLDQTTWSTVSGSSQTTGGAAGSHMFNVSGSGYHYMRGSYTRTSGSGSLTIKFSGN